MIPHLSRAKSIFLDAVDVPRAEDRLALLDARCAGDEGLRREVEGLLAHLGQVGSFLEPATPDPSATVDSPRAAEGAGTKVGPYELLEQIGEGGFGLVYMAEQMRPVRRKVALKVLKPAMASRQVVARFEAERQALALMDHPGIARVFDAGTTEGGQLYFVMELVKGIPITEFCDREKMPLRERLGLFVQVCQAVQHAHQKGVIHRDIKPSNVLVTIYDGRPAPKVIDFGIAKALSGPLTELPLHTGFAQMVGTPLYMSPEQAALSAHDVDTRSDVYSLGVLLYELLTGTTPFDGETLKKAGYDEMRRILREDEPPKPSTRVSTQGLAGTTASANRRTDPRRLSVLVRGELDWIVMKSLEKNRNRRYESASAFAADVQRHLDDEPVQACPPSAGYRLKKFARRNRRGLLTAGVIMFALVSATAISAWQAIEATTARRLADERADNEKQARQEAAQEAAVAGAVNDFLRMDLLKLADREVQTEYGFVANPNLTVREALHRAAGTVGQRFHDKPLVEAAIQATIGQAYIGVCEHGLATSHLKRSLTLYQMHLEPHHHHVIRAMDLLATAYARNWQFREAVVLVEKALETRTAKFGPDDPETLRGMQTLAAAYDDAGRYTDGIALCKKVLAKYEATFGAGHPSTERAIEHLVSLYRRAGQWERCAATLEPRLEKSKVSLGLQHPKTVSLMGSLARPYAHMGRLDEALHMHETVLESVRIRLGPEDDETINCLIEYSRTCWLAGKLEKADSLLHEAVRIARTWEGFRGAVGTAGPLMNLSQNLLLQQRYVEAEPLAREALAIYEKLRLDDWRRFNAMSLVGGALLGQQKYAEAEPLLIRGYEGLRERQQTIYRPQLGRLTEAGDRLVRFYEATTQPEKARNWRERTRSVSPAEREP